jgi:hypothetical protein
MHNNPRVKSLVPVKLLLRPRVLLARLLHLLRQPPLPLFFSEAHKKKLGSLLGVALQIDRRCRCERLRLLLIVHTCSDSGSLAATAA